MNDDPKPWDEMVGPGITDPHFADGIATLTIGDRELPVSSVDLRRLENTDHLYILVEPAFDRTTGWKWTIPRRETVQMIEDSNGDQYQTIFRTATIASGTLFLDFTVHGVVVDDQEADA